jgi:hypothetical protein
MVAGAYRSVVQKCVARLRLPAHSIVTREDGLWFDSHMLSHLRLPFSVYVWDITGTIATLTSSTNWGVGPHSLEQVTEACLGASHMSFSLGHMFPFPLGCGIPQIDELGRRLLEAATVEYSVSPPTVALPATPLDSIPFEVPAGIFPLFRPPCKSVHRHPPIAHLGSEASVATGMYYNVDSLTALDILFLCKQAVSLKLDFFTCLMSGSRLKRGLE